MLNRTPQPSPDQLGRDLLNANRANLSASRSFAYVQARQRLEIAEYHLRTWSRALDESRFCYRVVMRGWQRAYEARERAAETCCRSDPKQFCSDYPARAWLAVYLGLLPPRQ